MEVQWGAVGGEFVVYVFRFLRYHLDFNCISPLCWWVTPSLRRALVVASPEAKGWRHLRVPGWTGSLVLDQQGNHSYKMSDVWSSTPGNSTNEQINMGILRIPSNPDRNTDKYWWVSTLKNVKSRVLAVQSDAGPKTDESTAWKKQRLGGLWIPKFLSSWCPNFLAINTSWAPGSCRKGVPVTVAKAAWHICCQPGNCFQQWFWDRTLSGCSLGCQQIRLIQSWQLLSSLISWDTTLFRAYKARKCYGFFVQLVLRNCTPSTSTNLPTLPPSHPQPSLGVRSSTAMALSHSSWVGD